MPTLEEYVVKEVVLPPADGRSRVPRGDDPSEDALVGPYGSYAGCKWRGYCRVLKGGRAASVAVCPLWRRLECVRYRLRS